MMQSENINELVTALSKAQAEITPASKDSLNPHYKSKYADLGAVWEACRTPLSKNGLAVIQTTEMIGERLTVITTLAHSSGQWIKSHLPVLAATNTAQALGAALTYMRRYSLSAIAGVAPGEDDDGESAMAQNFPKKEKTLNDDDERAIGQNPPKKEKVLINKEQVTKLEETLPNCNTKFVETAWDYLKKNGIHQLDQLTVEIYDRLISGALKNVEAQVEHE